MAGKHRAPTTPLIPRLVKVGATGLVASTIPLVSVGNAEATEFSSSVLEVIARCESGNRNVNTMGNSTASGYLQILDSTWRAFRGTEFASRAIHATREEQFIVGARILAGQGISAWNPSRSCWGSKIGKTPQKVEVEVEKPKPQPKKAKAPISAPKKVKSAPKAVSTTSERVARSYVIKRGDTLSRIARTHGTTVKRLAALNRDTVKNPNLIYAGNRLRVR